MKTKQHERLEELQRQRLAAERSLERCYLAAVQCGESAVRRVRRGLRQKVNEGCNYALERLEG